MTAKKKPAKRSLASRLNNNSSKQWQAECGRLAKENEELKADLDKLRKEHEELRTGAGKLASCVIFGVANAKHLSRGGTRFVEENGKRVLKAWEETFFDALAAVGIEYDRKKYWKNRDKPKKRR